MNRRGQITELQKRNKPVVEVTRLGEVPQKLSAGLGYMSFEYPCETMMADSPNQPPLQDVKVGTP